MSDSATIAKPYAKAIFKYARDNQQLPLWSTFLEQLALFVNASETQSFISNPATRAEQHSKLLMDVMSDKAQQNSHLKNVVDILATGKRLLVLPAIYKTFESLRAEQEKTLTVHVTSFAPLSELQQQALKKALSARCQRDVTISITVDTSIMGGAIIQAGDLVIDGSITGKLNKLQSSLAA